MEHYQMPIQQESPVINLSYQVSTPTKSKLGRGTGGERLHKTIKIPTFFKSSGGRELNESARFFPLSSEEEGTTSSGLSGFSKFDRTTLSLGNSPFSSIS